MHPSDTVAARLLCEWSTLINMEPKFKLSIVHNFHVFLQYDQLANIAIEKGSEEAAQFFWQYQVS